MSKKIHFIITGGTLDKLYDPISQTHRLAKKSLVPRYIEKVTGRDISFETLAMIDSNEMTTALRGQLYKSILREKSDRIIITHGTDTMSVTAGFLKKKLTAKSQKTVILTGSMIPMKEFVLSDGGFNLGYAMAKITDLKPGVYIAMHGRVFTAGSVRKNKKLARFEKKS